MRWDGVKLEGIANIEPMSGSAAKLHETYWKYSLWRSQIAG